MAEKNSGAEGRTALGAPFPCDSKMILFSGRPTSWYEVEMVTGRAKLRGTLVPEREVNAIGYNVLDSYIYGYDQKSGQFVRVDSSGAAEVLTPRPRGLPAAFYDVGTLDLNGYYYLYASGEQRFYTVDLRPGSPTYLRLVDPAAGYGEQTENYGTALTQPLKIGDWVWQSQENVLYGVADDGTVYRIFTDGQVTALDTTGPDPGSTFGAAVMDRNGVLYAVAGGDGTIYRYLIEQDRAQAARFSATVQNAYQDGTMCPYAALEVDFGDAPDIGGTAGSGNYNTLLASDGPRHRIVDGLTLGLLITGETEAHQNAAADGDDLERRIQDDALTVPLASLHVTDSTYHVLAGVRNLTGTAANLYGWIDFNNNGLFEEEESVHRVVPASSQTQMISLDFTVPPSARLRPGHTFLRLRLTTDDLPEGTLLGQDTRSVGPASDGEVEDYIIEIQALADLSVEKTAEPDFLNEGERIIYRIVIRNQGPHPALAVRLTDDIPEEILDPEYSTDNGGTWNPWTGSLEIGEMQAGEERVVLIRGIFRSSTATEVENTARITTGSQDDNPDNNTSTVVTPVNRSADLSVTKKAIPSPAVAGEQVEFLIEVTNHGPDDALNARMTDDIPAVLERTEISYDQGASWQVFSGQTDVFRVPSGSSVTFHIRGMLSASAAGSFSNRAEVQSETPDPDLSNNTDTIEVPIDRSADLSVIKRVVQAAVYEGQRIEFTIVLENKGPSDAENVTLTDAVPAEIVNAEFSLNGGGVWNIWSGSYTWPDFPVGSSVTVQLRGTAAPGFTGTVTNTALVTSSVPDPNPDNNSSEDTVTVEPGADLTVSKTADPDSITAGQRVVYTITAGNLGPGRAENVIIRDAASPYLMETEYSIDDGRTWLPWSGSYAVTSLEVGESAEISLRGRTEPSFTGTLRNTVSVSSDTPDPNPGNNTDEAEVVVDVSADLSVRKTAKPNPAKPGVPVTYEVTVKNLGPSDAVQVILEDAMPAVLVNLEVSADDGENWEPFSGSWTTEFLAAGTFVRLLLRGFVPHNATGQLVNTVEVSSSTRDPYPDNNRFELVTPIAPMPELFITKTAYPDCAIPCEYLIYTILMENSGSADAEEVVLTDYVPRELCNLQFSADGGRTWSEWNGSEAIGTISKGETVSILIAGMVRGRACGVITNTASVFRAGSEEYYPDDSVTITTPVKQCCCCEPGRPIPLENSRVYRDFFHNM
nr:DUF11 domain-containing protein [uncultured Blautia sp.]